MNAHFFDIETILVIDSKVWLVDKNSPNFPVFKISNSDFNLIRSGIYKSKKNSIYFGGSSYWLPDDLMNSIKIKCKNLNIDITDLTFSMQEFMNSDIIETLDYDINIDNLIHLKNKNDDIYFICSKNNKKNYDKIIKKIENKLEEVGLFIKKYYFISDTFYNRDLDDISHKKIRLLLQHSIGMKTDGDKFVDDELQSYDDIYFYDDDQNTISLGIKCNNLLQLIIDNSDSDIKSEIIDLLKSENKNIYFNFVSTNKVKRFSTTKVVIKYNMIKTFENFNWKK